MIHPYLHFRRAILNSCVKMGRKKRQNKRNPLPYRNERNYSQTTKENELFKKFYAGLGLMDEQEVEDFYNQMKEPLPVTFRITGYKSQAQELLRIIRTDFFDKLIGSSPSSHSSSTPANTAADKNVAAGDADKPASDAGVKDQIASSAGEEGDKGDNEGQGLKMEDIKPPKCLAWYPDELAWQIDLSRKAIRSQGILSKLHQFLVSETETGNISRQEAVSMIPPLVLDVQSNSKVLDLCAAPGSKTAQLIEYLHKNENCVPEGFVVANDRDNKRCYLMVHQVKRLSSPCCMIVNHDASFFPKLYTSISDDKPDFILFDRVLADVPCSGDGTMRKNIDIWKKWQPTMANSLHGLQVKIVKRGLELLEVGGRLVYSTCSMHPAEDEAVIAEMLRKCEGAIQLVDISSHLPGFKTVAGLSQWKLMNKKGEWLDSYDSVPDLFKQQFTKSMFPPSPEEAAKFNLHLCHRILPHHQDTGGFFVAALQKVGHLPWSREARLEREKAAAAQEESVSSAVTEEGTDQALSKADHSGETTNGISSRTDSGDTTTTTTTDAGNCRKRKAETEEGPQPKKKDMKGYKEDPFLFLKPDDPVYPPIRDFYGLKEDFPVSQLLYRSESGVKRALYFVSSAIKQIVTCNEARIRFINMGIKFVTRSPSPVVPDCDFRITQECMGSLRDVFTKRQIVINKTDAITIFKEENPFFDKLSAAAQKALGAIGPGSVVFLYEPTDSEPEPGCQIAFCGWRGKTSVRCFVPRFERCHGLRLFGQDLTHIQAEVAKMKEERKAAREAEDTESDPHPPAHTHTTADSTQDDDEGCEEEGGGEENTEEPMQEGEH